MTRRTPADIATRRSGECPECGERWQPGELIFALSSDGTTTWVHAHCPDAPQRETRDGAVIESRCPRCGAAVRSITRETGGRWSLSCGDWITADEAVPILAARGDDT